MTQSGGRGDDSFWARPADGHGGFDDPTSSPGKPVEENLPPTPVAPPVPPTPAPQPPAQQFPPQQFPPQQFPPAQGPSAQQLPPAQQVPPAQSFPPAQGPAQQVPGWPAQPPQQAPWPQQPQPPTPNWQTGPAPRYPEIAANTQRSRRGGCLWMIVLSVIATLALNYCARMVSGIEVPGSEDTSTPHQVVIVVKTTTPTDINWSVGPQAGTATAKATWSRTVQAAGQKVVSVSAQTTGTKDTSVSCEITVDGKTIDTAAATKAGQLASCTGTTQ